MEANRSGLHRRRWSAARRLLSGRYLINRNHGAKCRALRAAVSSATDVARPTPSRASSATRCYTRLLERDLDLAGLCLVRTGCSPCRPSAFLHVATTVQHGGRSTGPLGAAQPHGFADSPAGDKLARSSVTFVDSTGFVRWRLKPA